MKYRKAISVRGEGEEKKHPSVSREKPAVVFQEQQTGHQRLLGTRCKSERMQSTPTSSSLYWLKGSKFDRTVPENKTGSCKGEGQNKKTMRTSEKSETVLLQERMESRQRKREDPSNFTVYCKENVKQHWTKLQSKQT